jgi:hypothetical protein
VGDTQRQIKYNKILNNKMEMNEIKRESTRRKKEKQAGNPEGEI